MIARTRAVLAVVLPLVACTAVRPPAVSDDPDELARAPIPGVASADPGGAVGSPAPAPAALAPSPAGSEPAPADAAADAKAPQESDAARPSSDGPVLPSLGLGPIGTVTTSPEERPQDDGPALQAKGQLLWQAILDDKPELAASFFFPKDAYVHVKAAKNPEGDWRWRLWKNFERDVHALHKTQGQALSRGTFKGLRIPSKKPHWAAPGNEYNRLGYWRVYGSHIVYELRGRERFVPISSLISWKSEWYVVHLTGFR
jgi:hypothetical protein